MHRSREARRIHAETPYFWVHVCATEALLERHRGTAATTYAATYFSSHNNHAARGCGRSRGRFKFRDRNQGLQSNVMEDNSGVVNGTRIVGRFRRTPRAAKFPGPGAHALPRHREAPSCALDQKGTVLQPYPPVRDPTQGELQEREMPCSELLANVRSFPSPTGCFSAVAAGRRQGYTANRSLEPFLFLALVQRRPVL